MAILLLLTFIWLIVLTIRYNHLEQTVRSIQDRLSRRLPHESQSPSPSAVQTEQSDIPDTPHPTEQPRQEVPTTQATTLAQPEPLPRLLPANASKQAIPHIISPVPNHAPEEAEAMNDTSPPLWPRVREVLTATGLWPDTSKGSLEAQLTTFIATRLGIILGIAALVFLAVHLGRNTPTWVRFIELLLVPTALCIVARLLRTRVAAFARVVLAGSMTMFYFTSFAAYAVPGVRIIDEAWLGFLLQIVTLLTIGIFASRRNAPLLAVLTQALGFVACAFAFYHGLTTYLLSGCFLLGTGGALLYANRQWRTCLWLGMAGTYGFYCLTILDAQRIGTMANWVQWLYPLLAYLMFFASERLTAIRLQIPQERTSVIHHSVNTGLALLTGFMAIETFQSESLKYFYLGATLIAAACAISFKQKPLNEWLTHQFTLKASILFSLFLLEVLDGNLRCIALLLQTLALLEGARRHPSKATLSAAIIAWLFSLGALLPVILSPTRELWQTSTVWISLYLLGSSSMLLVAARTLPLIISSYGTRVLQTLGGVLLGIASLATLYSLKTAQESTAAALINVLLLLVPVLAAIAMTAKRTRVDGNTSSEQSITNTFLGVAVAISIALVWAHCLACFLIKNTHDANSALQYWCGGIVVLSILLVLGSGLADSMRIRVAQHVLLIITSYTFYILTESLLIGGNLFAVIVLAGWLLALLCASPRYRHLAYIRLIPFALASLYLLKLSVFSAQATPAAIAWCALALAFGWQVAQPYWKALNCGFNRTGALLLHWTQAVLLAFAALIVVFLSRDELTRLLLLGSFSAAFLCIQRKRQPLPWLMQSLVLLIFAQLTCLYMTSGKAEGFTTLYLVQIALSALSICIAQNTCRHLHQGSIGAIAPIQTIGGLAALLPLLVVPMALLSEHTWLSLWYALPAFALVLTGLALHARPYRLIGLIALLLPLARLFVYDILDAVHRIIAFGLLAVVLLLTGYIYNRILEGGKRKEKSKTDNTTLP